MIAPWMLYSLLISLLFLVSGRALEPLARRLGVPLRSVWVGAVAGSLLLPTAGWLLPRSPGAAVVGELEVVAPALEAAAVPAHAPLTDRLAAALEPLDPLLPALWAGASLLVALYGLLSVLRLSRARRGWREATVGGRSVLLSDDVGPAVVGFLRSRIVVPAWVLTTPEPLRDLILTHEEEHRRTWDARLLLAGQALLVLFPWNLALWGQLHRLRLAVELDCDARVLRRGADPRSYGRLLLEVGRRRSALGLVAAFSEPVSFLERRIRAMTARRSGTGWGGTLALAGTGAALIAGACTLDRPGPVAPQSAGVSAPSGAVVAATGAEPTSTPYDTSPELRNRAEFARALERAYPAMLREAGIEGQVVLWVLIDETGAVTRTRVARSSGSEPLDVAARTALTQASFAPARHRGQAVAAWIQLPVAFRAPADAPEVPAIGSGETARTEVRVPQQSAAAPAPQRAARPDTLPTFTPFEVKPELRDRAEFARRLEEMKPAGAVGRVVLWVLVDEEGKVARTRVTHTSGNERIDEAAMEVMRTAKFTAARNRGEAVPVWIQIPVAFQSR